LILEESHADRKDEHFATLATIESFYNPKQKPLRPYLGSLTLVWESTLYSKNPKAKALKLSLKAHLH